MVVKLGNTWINFHNLKTMKHVNGFKIWKKRNPESFFDHQRIPESDVNEYFKNLAGDCNA